MSRIGKLPVEVPPGINIIIENNNVKVVGESSVLNNSFEKEIDIVFNEEERKIYVKPKNDTKEAKALWGLSRTLVDNMVKGVTEGFTKILEINGVGYKASRDKKLLTLSLGYSHEIKFVIPSDIEIQCEKPTLLSIFGRDKQKVGDVAAQICKLRSIDRYKGKGIKYQNQRINLKAGKKK